MDILLHLAICVLGYIYIYIIWYSGGIIASIVDNEQNKTEIKKERKKKESGEKSLRLVNR